jgi:hypothetical protein
LGQQDREVDDHVLRADGDARAVGALQFKAHHRLVDRADLLDVEGAVGEALAVEDQQGLEDAPEHAVGDAGGLAALAGLPGVAAGAALEEGVAVGVEEAAVAGGQVEAVVGAAGVDQAEQGQQGRARRRSAGPWCRGSGRRPRAGAGTGR